MAVAEVVLLTLAAGLAIPAGALLAHTEHLKQGRVRDEVLHAIIAFGGGALLAAVVLVLVPEGMERVPAPWVIVAFGTGALAILLLETWLQRRRTPAGQFTAMLSDFLPESIALGAAVAVGSDSAVLLALLIGLQNLPEGFNAYREVCDEWGRRGKVLLLLAAAAFLGPLAGLGGLALADQGSVIGVIELAAAGAIFALVFQDIAPLAQRRGDAWPTIGAIGGFLLGLAGHLWI